MLCQVMNIISGKMWCERPEEDTVCSYLMDSDDGRRQKILCAATLWTVMTVEDRRHCVELPYGQ